MILKERNCKLKFNRHMTYDQHVAIKQAIEASLRPTSKY